MRLIRFIPAALPAALIATAIAGAAPANSATVTPLGPNVLGLSETSSAPVIKTRVGATPFLIRRAKKRAARGLRPRPRSFIRKKHRRSFRFRRHRNFYQHGFGGTPATNPRLRR